MTISDIFLNIILATGTSWVIYLLIFCSILSISFIIERFLFYKKISGSYYQFLQILLEKMNAEDSLDSLKSWVDGQKLIEAKVVSAGLKKTHRSLTSRQESMYAALYEVQTQLGSGKVILATIGAVTPFIGLFGTVIGIIEAFNALSTLKDGNIQAVMSGISEALVATALGLFVAMPAVISYNLYQRIMKRRLQNCEALISVLLTYFENEKVVEKEKKALNKEKRADA
jgi:biopolymer transport protein ExbB/TolQ